MAALKIPALVLFLPLYLIFAVQSEAITNSTELSAEESGTVTDKNISHVLSKNLSGNIELTTLEVLSTSDTVHGTDNSVAEGLFGNEPQRPMNENGPLSQADTKAPTDAAESEDLMNGSGRTSGSGPAEKAIIQYPAETITHSQKGDAFDSVSTEDFDAIFQPVSGEEQQYSSLEAGMNQGLPDTAGFLSDKETLENNDFATQEETTQHPSSVDTAFAVKQTVEQSTTATLPEDSTRYDQYIEEISDIKTVQPETIKHAPIATEEFSTISPEHQTILQEAKEEISPESTWTIREDSNEHPSTTPEAHVTTPYLRFKAEYASKAPTDNGDHEETSTVHTDANVSEASSTVSNVTPADTIATTEAARLEGIDATATPTEVVIATTSVVEIATTQQNLDVESSTTDSPDLDDGAGTQKNFQDITTTVSLEDNENEQKEIVIQTTTEAAVEGHNDSSSPDEENASEVPSTTTTALRSEDQTTISRSEYELAKVIAEDLEKFDHTGATTTEAAIPESTTLFSILEMQPTFTTTEADLAYTVTQIVTTKADEIETSEAQSFEEVPSMETSTSADSNNAYTVTTIATTWADESEATEAQIVEEVPSVESSTSTTRRAVPETTEHPFEEYTTQSTEEKMSTEEEILEATTVVSVQGRLEATPSRVILAQSTEAEKSTTFVPEIVEKLTETPALHEAIANTEATKEEVSELSEFEQTTTSTTSTSTTTPEPTTLPPSSSTSPKQEDTKANEEESEESFAAVMSAAYGLMDFMTLHFSGHKQREEPTTKAPRVIDLTQVRTEISVIETVNGEQIERKLNTKRRTGKAKNIASLNLVRNDDVEDLTTFMEVDNDFLDNATEEVENSTNDVKAILNSIEDRFIDGVEQEHQNDPIEEPKPSEASNSLPATTEKQATADEENILSRLRHKISTFLTSAEAGDDEYVMSEGTQESSTAPISSEDTKTKVASKKKYLEDLEESAAETDRFDVAEPEVSGRILGHSVSFSVKITSEDWNFFVPPDAFLGFDNATSLVNITWKSSADHMNNSLGFNLYKLQKAQLNIVKDGRMYVHKPQDKLGESDGNVITLDEGIRVRFSNGDLQKIKDATGSDTGEAPDVSAFSGASRSGRVACIVVGCLIGGTLILFAIYFVVRKVRRRNENEKVSTPNEEA